MAKNNRQSLFDKANEAWDAGEDKLAFKLFLAAANNGEEDAFNSVGYFFDHGIGTQKNPINAYKWYRRAAMKGSLVGYLNLGAWFRDIGNIRRSKLWYKKAYDQGDGSAAYALGKLYMKSRSRTSLMHAKKYLAAAVASKYILDDEREDAKNMLLDLNTK